MTLSELNEIKKNYKVLEIAVDFINPSYNISRAKHLDNSRYLICTLTENGIPRNVKEYEAARIRLQKPDRTYVYNDCDVLEDGRVFVTLTEQILAVEGNAVCDIQLTDEETGIIYSTKNFIINIDKTAVDNSIIASSDEFDALNNLIASNKKLNEELKENEAERIENETHRQENETDRQNSEIERSNAEAVRMENENNRIASENIREENEAVRQENETDRETNTAIAVSNAETAAKKANDAANDLQDKLDSHYFLLSEDKGSANGVAELDANGKVPANQLPSYVDDVIEGYFYGSKFYKETEHVTEITGETGKIYIDLHTNKTYRWSGSTFAVISETLALGETSSTAYRGDKGKIAYDHSQSPHAPSDAQANQNAFSNITADSTAIAAKNTTDTLILTGNNITLTPDASNNNLEIGITKDNVTAALGYTPYTPNEIDNMFSANSIPQATQDTDGLLTAADKTKLDGIEYGANKYVHPTTSGNKHIPTGGSPGQILKWGADGTAVWDNASSEDISVTGIKGNNETEYRRGNVNITPDNIGALSTDGGTVEGDVTINGKLNLGASLYADGGISTKGVNLFGQGSVVYNFSGYPNATGYLRICRIYNINAYADGIIDIGVMQRYAKYGSIIIRITSNSSADSSISSFKHTGNIQAYIVEAEEGVWDIYMPHQQAYAYTTIMYLHNGVINSKILTDLEIRNVVSELPEGYIASTLDTITANLSGTASDAVKLATARSIKIGNQTNSFDGSGNITFTAANMGLAPTAHASTATGYGVGTTTNYGHCKTINDLTHTSYAYGEALSAYQGYYLRQVKYQANTVPLGKTITLITTANYTSYNTTYYYNITDNILISAYGIYAYGAPPVIFKLAGGVGTSTSVSSIRFGEVLAESHTGASTFTFVSASYNSGTKKLILKFTIPSTWSNQEILVQYNPSLTLLSYA